MKPVKVYLDQIPIEQVGGVSRQVLFAPSVTGNRHLKMCMTTLPPGYVSAPHRHLGEEITFALSGKAVITVEGIEYSLERNDAFLVPPGIIHPIRVIGPDPYKVLSVYCDDCCLLAHPIQGSGLSDPNNRG